MPIEATVGGRTARTDHLTLAQLASLRQRTGKRVGDINPWESAKDALALATVLLESAGQTAEAAALLPITVDSWLRPVGDDLPEMFRDGVPTLGGEEFDDYVAVFAFEPWCWPPDVTRRQRLRDLDLLIESAKGRRSRRR